MLTALIDRPAEEIFASGARTGEIIAFPNIPRGWGMTFDSIDDGGNGGFPPVEWANYLWRQLYQAMQYFLQRGVGEWAATTLYAPGSVVARGERIYRARRAHSNVVPGTDPNTWMMLADSADAAQLAPPGMVGLFAGPTVPAGWLKMNGATLARVSYPNLFAVIGGWYGAPDANTFNLPDARGEFFRAWDDGRGVDRGRAFASWQGEDMHPHWHTGTAVAVGDHAHAASAWTDVQGWHGHAVHDPGHSHPLYDPGHSHSFPHVVWGGGIGAASLRAAQGGAVDHGVWWQYSTAAAVTNMQISASGSNIGIYGDGNHAHNVGVAIGAAGAHAHSVVTDSQGIAETRPRNLAMLACIKY